MQLQDRDTRGLGSPGGCGQGVLPCRPLLGRGSWSHPGPAPQPGHDALVSALRGGRGGLPRGGRGWAGGGAVSRPPRGPLPPWSQVQTAGPGAAGRGRTGLPGAAAGAAPAGLHGECAGTIPSPRDPFPLLRDTLPWSPLVERSPPHCRDGVGLAGVGLAGPAVGLGTGREVSGSEMSLGATGRGAGPSGKGSDWSGWGRTTWERAWSRWNGAGLGPNGTWILRRAAMGQSWESVRKGLWSGRGSWSSWDQAAVSGMRLRPRRDGVWMWPVLRERTEGLSLPWGSGW